MAIPTFTIMLMVSYLKTLFEISLNLTVALADLLNWAQRPERPQMQEDIERHGT